MATCEFCKMRDYTTPAVTTVPGFNEDGDWSWSLPVCAAHEGVQGVKPCEPCEEQGRIVPGQKQSGWDEIMCEDCIAAAQMAELRERVVG